MTKRYIAAGSTDKMTKAFRNRIEQLEEADINSSEILADDEYDEYDEDEYEEEDLYFKNPDLSDYEQLLKEFGVSEEAIDLVQGINGSSIDTLNDISEYVFGESIEDLNSKSW